MESWKTWIAAKRPRPRQVLISICAVYLIMSASFASTNLDVDEFSFVREPYELVGGDYTRGYLAAHEFRHAANTVLKSYYFYWKYRPLFSPIIDDADKHLFQQEEVRFGYKKPESFRREWDPDRIEKYSQRLVVPEPDKFYSRGAGKPLLPALLSIPQLGLVDLVTSPGKSLVFLTLTYNYHPVFILVRLAQILSGLVTILLVYWILSKEMGVTAALFGASVMAFFPLSITSFPDLHHDAIMVPFVLLTAYYFYKQKYIKSGIFFGLSLASKNSAIILAPALLAYVIWEAYADKKADIGVGRPLRAGMKGWATAMLLGALVLLPFANPISFANEILTPITQRQYDPRGENVSAFTVAGRLQENRHGKWQYRTITRPEVRLMDVVSGFQDVGFFFICLTLVTLSSQLKRPLPRMSLLVLMLSVPFGLIFGHELGYRTLMFVPFFALLAAHVGKKGPLLSLIALLLVIDIVYCRDPMTIDMSHIPSNSDTLFSALSAGLGWGR